MNAQQIYAKHDSTFKLVSAGALVVDGVQKGTLAFKFPASGEGVLLCFFHIHGTPMVIGKASGYGYDKKGAALEKACESLCDIEHAKVLAAFPALKDLNCDGEDFQRTLEKAGLTYFSAI
jgi:hypothetical protein